MQLARQAARFARGWTRETAQEAGRIAAETLTTAVQPATIAGAIFWAMPGSGKLNAVSAAITPTGSRTSRLLLSYFMISPPAAPAIDVRSASRTSAKVCSRPTFA